MEHLVPLRGLEPLDGPQQNVPAVRLFDLVAVGAETRPGNVA
jgi:hypothetical protein